MTDQSQSNATKVFICEPQEITRAGLISLLEKERDIAVVGGSGDVRQSLESINATSPDIVLVDLAAGAEWQAVARIAGKTAEVICLSSSDSFDDLILALTLGAKGYICKNGLQAILLRTAIRSVSCGAAWFDPQISNRIVQACASVTKRKARRSKVSKEARSRFSDREREILQLVAKGLSNGEIGRVVGLSPETVKTHLRRIMEKLEVSTRTQAAMKAVELGIAAPSS